jgi:hypothetical protein
MTINYLAVLLCGIAAMVVGFIWYGVLFGKTWMKLMGADTMSAEKKEAMKKSMGGMYFLQFIMSLITAGVLDYFITNAAASMPSVSGVCIAVTVWFGFVLTTEAGAALWSGKPKKTAWKMFLISASGALVTFIVFGLILSAWH